MDQGSQTWPAGAMRTLSLYMMIWRGTNTGTRVTSTVAWVCLLVLTVQNEAEVACLEVPELHAQSLRHGKVNRTARACPGKAAPEGPSLLLVSRDGHLPKRVDRAGSQIFNPAE